ncbi:hypothetical protein PILCRDRAFT_74311, partial [Piloderma croceum F 1598]
MLNSLNLRDWDLIMIQEPYIAFNDVTRATPPWRVVYPRTHKKDPKATHAVILVSKALSTDQWEELPVNSPDIAAIRISGTFGRLRLFNVYNHCDHSRAIQELENFL